MTLNSIAVKRFLFALAGLVFAMFWLSNFGLFGFRVTLTAGTVFIYKDYNLLRSDRSYLDFNREFISALENARKQESLSYKVVFMHVYHNPRVHNDSCISVYEGKQLRVAFDLDDELRHGQTPVTLANGVFSAFMLRHMLNLPKVQEEVRKAILNPNTSK